MHFTIANINLQSNEECAHIPMCDVGSGNEYMIQDVQIAIDIINL